MLICMADQQPGDGGFQVLTNLTQDNAGGFIYASAQTYSGKKKL